MPLEGDAIMRTIAYCASALALLTFAPPASANTVPFIDTTPGPTTFVVQQTGVYDILAFGAQAALAKKAAEGSERKSAATSI